MTVAILAGLFAIQRFGTGNVGRMFGPVVLLWFTVLAALGIWQFCRNPQILLSLSPWEGVAFLQREWSHALPILGATFLAVTGGEALYADLGHFGRKPIRVGWFAVVFPALALNYLGQAALVTLEPQAIRSPFFLMAGPMLVLPLTVLAALAAIIASQALISGAFSLTVQAIQLGCLPRCNVRHTSHHERGQVYVPFVNWMLAAGCILLVVTLKTSSALAGAYGIAISLTMVITSILLIPAARLVLGWAATTTISVSVLFLSVDLAYLVANATKLLHMGWLPLVAAMILIFLMLTWIWGRDRLAKRFAERNLESEYLISELAKKKIHRVAGVAVYLSGSSNRVPPALLHNLKHNKVIHETTILLHVQTLDQPKLEEAERLECRPMGEGIWDVSLKFGFAETPDVPRTLRSCLPEELRFHEGKASYFLGRETYCIGKKATLFDRFRLFVFALLARNAAPANAYFQLPPGRVVELGSQLTL
jgi:KUP system potassium uptake protein